MPPIPKFAKALAELAKDNPKVIPEKTLPQIKKGDNLEKKIEKQIETKKFAKDDMEIDKISREKIKKELNQNLIKKDDLYEIIDLSKMELHNKLDIYKTGEEVKVYDSNNTGKFVEILWPENSTVENLISLVKSQIVDNNKSRIFFEKYKT